MDGKKGRNHRSAGNRVQVLPSVFKKCCTRRVHVYRRSDIPVIAPLRVSLDCPVLRLTLLFLAAAKDVPEAATAGTTRLDSRAD
jgi:hypothetical protein